MNDETMMITEEEWRRFIPGVRIYEGKKTLFYNGEYLVIGGNDYMDEIIDYLIYNEEERDTWEAIVILSGVDIIPAGALQDCENVETVIMADTVKEIQEYAFAGCSNLTYIRLSRNLEEVGNNAFGACDSLTSIFIPPSCRSIGEYSFSYCPKLLIVSVPEHTHIIDDTVIDQTALMDASPFEPCDYLYQNFQERINNLMEEFNHQEQYALEITDWMKGINRQQQYALHRECASTETTMERIYEIIKREGFASFGIKNKIGISPSRYLQENPFIEMNEKKIINRFVFDMMGISDEINS